jgi:hypothetical protein
MNFRPSWLQGESLSQKKINPNKQTILIYENGKMRPVETIPGLGEQG